MFMIKHIPKKLGILLAKEFFKKFKKRHISVPLDSKSLSINLVTSWDKQCGIATYSAFLAKELKKNVHLYITVLPKKNALSKVTKLRVPKIWFMFNLNTVFSQD
jgi:L-rhamnose mutarotase